MGTTSSHHSPYVLGYTHVTMDRTTGCDSATGSQSLKSILSSDCALKPERMKMDLLVIADQHAAVNTFSGLVQNKLRLSTKISSR